MTEILEEHTWPQWGDKPDITLMAERLDGKIRYAYKMGNVKRLAYTELIQHYLLKYEIRAKKDLNAIRAFQKIIREEEEKLT